MHERRGSNLCIWEQRIHHYVESVVFFIDEKLQIPITLSWLGFVVHRTMKDMKCVKAEYFGNMKYFVLICANNSRYYINSGYIDDT